MKTYTVVANSVKHHNRCVMVMDEDYNIMRLVSDDQSTKNAIPSEWMWGIKRFTRIHLQDIPQLQPAVGPQTENYLITDKPIIERDSTQEEMYSIFSRLVDLSNPNAMVFGNEMDYLTTREASRLSHSYEFLCVDNLQVYLREYQDRKQSRASFDFNGYRYDFSMTDPAIHPPFELDKALILITIPGEAWQPSLHAEPRHYKFVSGILCQLA